MTIPESVKGIGAKSFAGRKRLTIYTPARSTAEQYAVENGIKFEIL